MPSQNKSSVNSAPVRPELVSQRPRATRSESEREAARRMLELIGKGSDIRQRKVRRVKAAIKVRAYENDLKFEVALERLSADVAPPSAATGRPGKGRGDSGTVKQTPRRRTPRVSSGRSQAKRKAARPAAVSASAASRRPPRLRG